MNILQRVILQNFQDSIHYYIMSFQKKFNKKIFKIESDFKCFTSIAVDFQSTVFFVNNLSALATIEIHLAKADKLYYFINLWINPKAIESYNFIVSKFY